MTDQVERLSLEGMQRREAMLVQLKRHMGAVHRRRRAGRIALAMAAGPAIVAAAVVVARAPSMRPSGVTPTIPQLAAEEPGAVDREYPIIAIVQTDPTVLDRWRAESIAISPPLTDDGLLQSLADAGIVTGLARCGDRVWLTRPVLEAELPPSSPQSRHFGSHQQST